MPATNLYLTIEQGATFRHSLALKAGAGSTAPALNLTGYSARMQLRADYAATDVLLELTSANSRIIITPLAGMLELSISAADTGLLEFSKAIYDLEIESASGEVTRIVQGVVTLSKEVTR